jgi:Zn-dependent protease
MSEQPVFLPPVSSPSSMPGVPGPPPEQEQRESIFKRAGSLLLVIGAVLLKFGKIALLFVGKAKFLVTSGSMLVSVAAYSLIFGWTFAVGFVLLLLVHEMGHVIQLRREGIEASAPLFIPFFGAVVAAKSLGGNALAEARVGLAGPVLGTLGTLALVPIWLATDSNFWQALIFTGLFLNLFNLLPISPLDGGRAAAAMSPWLWLVGVFGMVVLVFAAPNPIIVLIAIVAVYQTYTRFKALRAGGEEIQEYYRVKPRHRLMVAAVYLGLIAVLVIGMDATFLERSFGDA